MPPPDLDALENAIRGVRDTATNVQVVYQTSSGPLLDASRPSSNIVIFDSSFNPPTRAHLALASLYPSNASRPEAIILLLSVRNVDKKLKDGDATYVQRLQMISLLADVLAQPSSGHTNPTPQTAVAVIDEPTFAGKSSLLLSHLRSSIPSNLPHTISLTFVIGYDTLIRLFDPKYYSDSHETMHATLRTFFNDEGSHVICARRATTQDGKRDKEREKEEEDAFISKEDVQPYVANGAITMMDIGEHEASMSSTRVRQGIAEGIEDWRTLTIPAIAEYITVNKLYTAPL